MLRGMLSCVRHVPFLFVLFVKTSMFLLCYLRALFSEGSGSSSLVIRSVRVSVTRGLSRVVRRGKLTR